ncbi:GntR family transcriptional regulator [Govanella unica]|uniref:GntR family transcriptional regulator n=1 Tax=Govanella unica TaxID=2975056 RepID=A0A9X3TVP6_9PROT|nr:GntR family transcriptional regulator [Govania unica]MDA5192567.1 GntR family transcriptional regulator [Govania unica]
MTGKTKSGEVKSGKVAVTRSGTKPAKSVKPEKPAGPVASSQISVVDTVVDRIRQKIMRGQFVPGQRLIEPDLAEQINVSRTALREAFRRLAAEGLVELALYKGATVRLLGKKDVEEAYLIREMLEGLVARLATPVIYGTPKLKKALLDLRAVMRTTVKSSESIDAYSQSNTEFHKLLVEAAGSAQLERLVEQVQLPMYRIVYVRLLSETAREKSMKDHERIIEAILKGDAKAAEAAMRAHVQASGQSLLTLSDDYFS